jgi:hypothetical protein
MWKDKKMHDNKLLNLKYYFDKFGGSKEENKEKPTAVAAPPAVGHDHHTVGIQPWDFDWKLPN